MAPMTREQIETLQRLVEAVRRMVRRFHEDPDKRFLVRQWMHLLVPCEQIVEAALAFPPAVDGATPLGRLRALLTNRRTMPVREEYLGGQRTNYVQLDTVLGHLDNVQAAQAPPASDPPGLREAVAEFQRAHADYQRAKHEDVGQEVAWAARKAARNAVLAYPLPASPQAETKGDES